jgi:P-type Ca2+ transporter type 2C
METPMTPVRGLTTPEAEARLLESGPNEIYRPQPIRFLDIALEELQEPMMLLLVGTGILYSVLGKLGDALTIFAVIILLVLSEVFTEFRAKRAISALGRIAALKAMVERDGRIGEVPSWGVVPQDLLILTPGTKVAADARVERSIGLEVDESALTGESLAVSKGPADELYAGTVVIGGEGRALVVVTGAATRLGRIAAQSRGIKVPRTPLQLAMKALAGKLVYVALFFALAIPLVGLLRGQDWRLMVMTGLALAFAVIPEELPIIITMVLGLGSYTLSRSNLLIKKLRATESLANTTVIVTDKTGTITESKMSMVATFPQQQRLVLRKAALCVSEFALNAIDLEVKRRAEALDPRPLPEIVRERGLGDGRKSRCVLRREGQALLLGKSGAPEEVLPSCRDVVPEAWTELALQTSSGRRVIAVAYRQLEIEEEHTTFDDLERDMDFVGLIAFEDPPRQGVKETIARAAAAGIRTIMVTGDHAATASSISAQVGINVQQVLTGSELDALSDAELGPVVNECSVFARTTPEHKYRIVQALQGNHEVVAVTGDGINDVLALKGADIGIAMGRRGTDVAREAADVILADDNYNTITQGVFEGRVLFDNLQKGMRYYLCIKLALILIFLVPVLVGLPMPFSPIQIIILELFMDLAASAGFVAEPKEGNIYTRKPRDPQEPIFGRRVLVDLVVKSLVLFAAVTVVFVVAYTRSNDMVQAQTLAFAAWIAGHVVLAYICRSDRESILAVGILANRVMNVWAAGAVAFLLLAIYLPYVNNLVRLAAVAFPSLLLVLVGVTAVVSLLEVWKMPFFRRT